MSEACWKSSFNRVQTIAGWAPNAGFKSSTEYNNKYKHIECGGRCLYNQNVHIGKSRTDKWNFQKKSKFCITFENCSTPGYCTKKYLIIEWVDNNDNAIKSLNHTKFAQILHQRDTALLHRDPLYKARCKQAIAIPRPEAKT